MGVCTALGCASPALQKVVSSEELRHELPEKFQGKLDVKEVSQPESVTTPVLSGKIPRKKNEEKRKPRKEPIASAVQRKDFYLPRGRVINPILLGEKHIFDVSYLGVVAGGCEMEVMPMKEIGGRKAFHVKGTSFSGSVFSMVYRINDRMETYFDQESLASYRFHMFFDESSYSGDALQLVDPDKQESFFWSRTSTPSRGFREKKLTESNTGWVQDSFSAVYYVRTLALRDGESFSFPLVAEGKQLEAKVQVVGRETYSGPSVKIRAIKLKVDIHYQGMLQKRGNSYMWISDDENRQILRLDASVKIGTVSISLRNWVRGQGKIEKAEAFDRSLSTSGSGAPEL